METYYSWGELKSKIRGFPHILIVTFQLIELYIIYRYNTKYLSVPILPILPILNSFSNIGWHLFTPRPIIEKYCRDFDMLTITSASSNIITMYSIDKLNIMSTVYQYIMMFIRIYNYRDKTIKSIDVNMFIGHLFNLTICIINIYKKISLFENCTILFTLLGYFTFFLIDLNKRNERNEYQFYTHYDIGHIIVAFGCMINSLYRVFLLVRLYFLA